MSQVDRLTGPMADEFFERANEALKDLTESSGYLGYAGAGTQQGFEKVLEIVDEDMDEDHAAHVLAGALAALTLNTDQSRVFENAETLADLLYAEDEDLDL